MPRAHRLVLLCLAPMRIRARETQTCPRLGHSQHLVGSRPRALLVLKVFGPCRSSGGLGGLGVPIGEGQGPGPNAPAKPVLQGNHRDSRAVALSPDPQAEAPSTSECGCAWRQGFKEVVKLRRGH